MCTYHTEHVAVSGSAKGTAQWIDVTHATVYVDHPYHTAADHTLNIDFLAPAAGAGVRVAVELTLDSAHELMRSMDRALQTAAVLNAIGAVTGASSG